MEVKLNNSISGIINCLQCSHLVLPNLHQSQTWWTTKRSVFIQNTAHLAFNFASKFHRQISTYTFFCHLVKFLLFIVLTSQLEWKVGLHFLSLIILTVGWPKMISAQECGFFSLKICIIGINQLKDKFHRKTTKKCCTTHSDYCHKASV